MAGRADFSQLLGPSEFVNAISSPHSTAGNLGYTQMNFCQSYNWPLLPASGNQLLRVSVCRHCSILLGRLGSSADRRTLAIASGCALLGVLGFGGWRLYPTPLGLPTVKVGLLASDLRQNILPTNMPILRLLRDYAVQVETLATQGASIVIPEKIAVLRDSELAEVDPMLQSTAEKTRASIVVGMIHPTTGANWNEARLYFPNRPIRTYDKHHMLPPSKAISPSARPVPSGRSLRVCGESPSAKIWISRA